MTYVCEKRVPCRLDLQTMDVLRYRVGGRRGLICWCVTEADGQRIAELFDRLERGDDPK